MASPPLGLFSRHAVDAGDLELLARGPVAFRRIPQPVQKPCVLCAGGDRQDRRYRPLCPGGVGTEAGTLEGHRSRIGTGRLPAARPVFCPPSFLPYARRVRADSQPHSSHGTTDHFFSYRNFSDSGRNRISRPWRTCSSTRDGLAILDIGLAPSPIIRVGAHRARTKPPRDGRVVATYRLGSGGVRLACLPLAEPLVSYRPSYLHESLVGIIQRRQKCIGWLVSVRFAGGEYLASHRDNSVLDEAKAPSQVKSVAESRRPLLRVPHFTRTWRLLRAVGSGLMSGCFPDACVLIEPFIGDAVKHDRTVIQPFQIVSLVFTLFCDCARLFPERCGDHPD